MTPAREPLPDCAFEYCTREPTHHWAPYCSEQCELATRIEDLGCWGKWVAFRNHDVGVISLYFDGQHITDFDIDNTKQMDAWRVFRDLLTPSGPAMPRQIDGVFRLESPTAEILELHADMAELTRRHGEERAVVMVANMFAMMVRENVIKELTHQQTAGPCP